LKHLIEFIEKTDIKNTKIYKELNRSKKEAQILKFVTQKYIEGFDVVSIREIIKTNSSKKELKSLKLLTEIKNLIDLEWIRPIEFISANSSSDLKLQLLSLDITLSLSFLQLLENGSLDVKLPDNRAYSDHLEYLQDQFEIISLLHKISISNRNSIDRLGDKLTQLKERVENRIKLSTKPLIVEEFIKSKKLENNQRVIFLALLKEEYSGSEGGGLRDMNSLLALISNSEYEKIKNRALLEDGAYLITNNIIDYEEILNPFGGISRSFYLQDEIMKEIIYPNQKKKIKKVKINDLIEKQDIFEYLEAKTNLEDVVLHQDTRDILSRLQKQIDKNVLKKLRDWGIKSSNHKSIDAKIIFYGHSGTGKTMTAVSLAKTLKKPILSFDCSKILSMYVGESEKNVRKIFDDFRAISQKIEDKPILLLNEADQFLSSRSEGAGSSADKMHNQMQNIFLEQIERFDGILIATTNLLDNIDKAFSRRFNYKVEFKKPDISQRVRLWQFMLPENADYEEGFDINRLAKYDLTGGQINLIIKNSAYRVAVRDESIFKIEDFIDEIKRELGSSFGNDINMGFKV